MQPRPRLAVVEDDLDLQELIHAFFRPRDYDVRSYDDPSVLLAELEKSDDKLQFDVILTDLNLPNMTGMELTKKIRHMNIMVPVILMTTYKSIETALEAVEIGAYDFVVKPIHFPQLLMSVERALHLYRVQSENQTLKTIIHSKNGMIADGVVSRSVALRKVIDLAKRVANSTANVLITGETGTGKEVLARIIHESSNRRNAQFVAINCSAVPETLLESELFGHAKGAFTGASIKKIGLFEEAEGGTLFLDEIGDLKLSLQSKLLRVLQEKKIKRIGENQYRPINTRIISATHKNLAREIRENRFREDLYFRLKVVPFYIPPLRERREDIIPLTEFFIKKYSILNQKSAKKLHKSAMEYLLSQAWPGNVRELENTIERAVILSEGNVIDESDLVLDNASTLADAAPLLQSVLPEELRIGEIAEGLKENKLMTLQSFTNKYIMFALKMNEGAKDKTAKDLAIDRKTLYRRIKEIEHSAEHH